MLKNTQDRRRIKSDRQYRN